MRGWRGIVATCRAAIPAGNHIGNALRRGLLGQIGNPRSFGGGGSLLTAAKTFGHHVAEVVVDDVQLRQIYAVGAVGGRRNHKVYVGLLRQGVGVTDVQNRFESVAIRQNSRISSIQDNLRCRSGNAKATPKIGQVLRIDI